MHTAISTVGYGEMTPRSFLGRLITLPLLLFGLLLIALPSFVLGREFSVIWNDMTSGNIQRTPYMQSELVRAPLAFPCITDLTRRLGSLHRARGSSRTCARVPMDLRNIYTPRRNPRTRHPNMTTPTISLYSRRPLWRLSLRRCAPPWTRRALCCGG
jgi:hypothetical protein